MRTRKNVKSLTETEKTNFVSAVLALKKKPSTLHPGITGFNRYDDYVEVHRSALNSAAWAHGGPAFLPWHREFILQFENDLQSIDASVTLPYWDWTDTSAASPLTADFLGGNGTGADQIVTDGPFAGDKWKLHVKEDPGDSDFLQRDLGSDPTAPALPTQGLQNSILNLATYAASPRTSDPNTFQWQCEIALHNLTQRFVGGTMDTTAAPNDPLFFLHAANIDRLYAVWQGLHQASAHYLPVAGAAQGHNLNDPLIFHSSGTAPFQTNATPASVLSHRNLGYQYDTEAQVSLGALKISAAHLQVLYGLLNDAPGVAINLGGDDQWTQLSAAARDTLIGFAVNELAEQISNADVRNQVQTAVAPLLANQAGKVRAASS